MEKEIQAVTRGIAILQAKRTELVVLVGENPEDPEHVAMLKKVDDKIAEAKALLKLATEPK